MNIFGIALIVIIAAGLLFWKKCGGGCGMKKKGDEHK